MTSRRFPPPWTVEEYRGISFIVRDANNFAAAYVYFESDPGRRPAAQLMSDAKLLRRSGENRSTHQDRFSRQRETNRFQEHKQRPKSKNSQTNPTTWLSCID
jgi:hypothetical protein